MLETILIIGVILYVVITITRIFVTPNFYNPSPAYFHDQLPDLRLADWSPASRTYHLEKVKQQKRIQEQHESYMEITRLEKEIALAKRIEAWKNGTPHQKMPEVRGTRRTNEVREMPPAISTMSPHEQPPEYW